MATNLNTLSSSMRSRNTVLGKHDLQLILDEAVLRAGEGAGLSAKSSVLDFETAGTIGAGAFTLTFVTGNETDPDGWKQVGNTDFDCPAGKGGIYQLSATVTHATAAANDELTIEIKVNGTVVAADTDNGGGAGSRAVSASIGVALIPTDTVTFTGIATAAETMTLGRISIASIG